MIGEDLRRRTRQFAIDTVRPCIALGSDAVTRELKPQLLRAGTGVAGNYRGACRARSGKEFAARLGVAVEEADESELWQDIFEAVEIGPMGLVKPLRQEAIELRAILATSRSTTLDNLRKFKKPRIARPPKPEP